MLFNREAVQLNYDKLVFFEQLLFYTVWFS